MTDGLKVVSSYQFSLESQKVLREAANADGECIAHAEEFQARLQQAAVVCANWMPVKCRELAPHLRWLQCPSAGGDGLGPTGVLDPGGGVVGTTAARLHRA